MREAGSKRVVERFRAPLLSKGRSTRLQAPWIPSGHESANAVSLLFGLAPISLESPESTFRSTWTAAKLQPAVIPASGRGRRSIARTSCRCGRTARWSEDLTAAVAAGPYRSVSGAHVVRRGRRVQAETGGQGSGLQIELKGNLAAMLSAAKNATRSPETGDLELQIAMVAGACNRRYLQLSSVAG